MHCFTDVKCPKSTQFWSKIVKLAHLRTTRKELWLIVVIIKENGNGGSCLIASHTVQCAV